MNTPGRNLRGIATALAFALAGCAASSSAPSLFVLDPSYPAHQPTDQARYDLIVAPVTVAPYLDESGIVYQTGPHRIVVANGNRWASPLPSQLTDGLYAALVATLDEVEVQKRSARRTAPGTLRLSTHVDEFFGHYDGTAHIAGRWALLDADGNRLAGARFERRIPLNADGYEALVESLSRGWRQTAQTMVPALEAELPNTGTSP